MTNAAGGSIHRLSTTDVVSLATDVGPVPMQVGAVVLLAGPADAATLAATIARRAARVPRLGQRLQETPIGCGRDVWVDDPDFQVDRHVSVRSCPAPGDESALLAVAADEVWARLPEDRPLWRAVIVDGLAGGGAAVVVAFHHVLADGIGGLAVLGHLVDGGSVATGAPVTRSPAPRTAALLRDAWDARVRALWASPVAMGAAAAGVRSLLASRPARASRSSLNQPTGPDRALGVARIALEPVHAVARAHGATVNDVLLTCVASAVQELLRRRGEQIERLVISVPVSTRRSTDVSHLGNATGTALVEVPIAGEFAQRVAAVAVRTREVRTSPSEGGTTALVAPLFRALARLGAFRWFIDRQRAVNTFVTNLHGPDERLSLAGLVVDDVIPVALITGNVPLAFAVLSYAGQLDATVVADPLTCPDWRSALDELQRSLDRLAASDRTGR